MVEFGFGHRHGGVEEPALGDMTAELAGTGSATTTELGAHRGDDRFAVEFHSVGVRRNRSGAVTRYPTESFGGRTRRCRRTG